jgi:hypothetical protein
MISWAAAWVMVRTKRVDPELFVLTGFLDVVMVGMVGLVLWLILDN